MWEILLVRFNGSKRLPDWCERRGFHGEILGLLRYAMEGDVEGIYKSSVGGNITEL